MEVALWGGRDVDDSNISEFQKVSKTRFYQDNFIETVEFDYLEIQVIEED